MSDSDWTLPKDIDITLPAAALVAAEVVAAERCVELGAKVRVPSVRNRLTVWRAALRAMRAADPCYGQVHRHEGGTWEWTFWAYNEAARVAGRDANSFDSDMAWAVKVKPDGSVDVHAFGEEVADLGRGFYHPRQAHEMRNQVRSGMHGAWALYPSPDADDRGDHETPQILAHRRVLARVLGDACRFVTARTAARRL